MDSARLSDVVRAALQTSQGDPAQESTLFAGLKGDDLLRAKAQFMLQKQQETVAFITKVMKNDMEMQVINSLR